MARSRQATSEEVEAAVTEGLSRLTQALRSPAAPQAIAKRMAQLDTELAVWEFLLDKLKQSTEEELNRILAISPERIAEESREATPTVDDLEVLRQIFQVIAQSLQSEVSVAAALSPEISRFLQRVTASKEPTARRFRPEFEEAFRRRQLLEAEGKTITAEALAQELMPAEYQRNPESAVRNLQQGLRRVAREHERCKSLSIPSPFLPSE